MQVCCDDVGSDGDYDDEEEYRSEDEDDYQKRDNDDDGRILTFRFLFRGLYSNFPSCAIVLGKTHIKKVFFFVVGPIGCREGKPP